MRLPVELPGPLLALAAGDLDGDKVAELIALTEHQVVVLGVSRETATVKASLALAGPPPVPRPRVPVGAVVVADVDGNGHLEILARSSEHAAGVRLAWKAGALELLGDPPAGFPLAALPAEPASGEALPAEPASGEALPAEPAAGAALTVCSAMLVPGTHVFRRDETTITPTPAPALPPIPERFLALAAARLRLQEMASPSGVADTTGAKPARLMVAILGLDGILRILRAGDRSPWARLDGVGTAFALADLDDDHQLELATSAARAAADGDELVIRKFRLVGRNPRVLYRSDLLRGGVAAMTTGDLLDGDGVPELAAFVRAPGSSGGELWVF